MHPINDIRGTKSKKLAGKRIVLGITGSIAAVETIKLARELTRHGAEVIPVMSSAATRIIHPDAIHFATGLKPIIELDGAVKHVELCGESSSRADLLLIAPATANTISKMAHGIDDTPVTTMATCAMGSRMPIVIVPAMHGSMYKHRILLDNIKILEKHGVDFVQPRKEEGKAKIAGIDEIVNCVLRTLGPKDMAKKKILIIAGSTRERIDDIRFITNMSSGRTGIELAIEADRRSAKVELWHGPNVDPPESVKSQLFTDVNSLEKLAGRAKADIIIVPAAISDFVVEKSKKGKISSGQPPKIKLHKAPRILEILRKNKNTIIVGFKAETRISERELEKRARQRMKDTGIDMIVANLMEDVGPEHTKALLITKAKTDKFKGPKSDLAELILDIAAEL